VRTVKTASGATAVQIGDPRFVQECTDI